MRVLVRHHRDVDAALTDIADYRHQAEALGMIGIHATPMARLTEARHALQSAIMPQPGEQAFQTPVRRQREVLRALDQIVRVSEQMGQQAPQALDAALLKGGPAPQPSWSPATAIANRHKQIASSITAPRGASDAFLNRRFIDHARTAINAIYELEQSLDRHGPGMESQTRALELGGQLRAIAYAGEARRPGSSLAARHTELEYDAMKQPKLYRPGGPKAPTATAP